MTIEEIFDVVDQNDRVIGQVPRSVVHREKLLHRAASVFVFNSRRELLLQLRSASKDEYPNCYTASASGHLAAGEDYEVSVARELEEELGLTSPLRFLTKFPAGPETAYEHTALYETTTDTVPCPDAGEIAGIEFAALEEVAVRVAKSPKKFTPPFRVAFAWYFQTFNRPKND